MQVTHVCRFVLAFCAVAIERLSFCVGVLCSCDWTFVVLCWRFVQLRLNVFLVLCWRFVQFQLNVLLILLALIFNFQLSFVFLWNKLSVGKFLMMLSWKHFAIFCNSIYVLANFHPVFSWWHEFFPTNFCFYRFLFTCLLARIDMSLSDRMLPLLFKFLLVRISFMLLPSTVGFLLASTFRFICRRRRVRARKRLWFAF